MWSEATSEDNLAVFASRNCARGVPSIVTDQRATRVVGRSCDYGHPVPGTNEARDEVRPPTLRRSLFWLPLLRNDEDVQPKCSNVGWSVLILVVIKHSVGPLSVEQHSVRLPKALLIEELGDRIRELAIIGPGVVEGS